MKTEYEKNAGLLEQAVAQHAFLRSIAFHRSADGALDIRGNLELWNRAMEPFIKTRLWAHTPGWDGRDPLQGEPYFVFIPAPAASAPRAAVLIAHGGGFALRTGCEGANAAWYFHQAGFPVAILSYRLQPYDRLASLADLQRAIRLLRARREDFGIGTQITVLGFSAGGMICGNAATHFTPGDPAAADPAERESDRPDACVVCYGAMSAVSFPTPFLEEGGQPELFGTDPAQRFWLAPEKNVTPRTPPFFIWQTLSDDGRHGLCLAKALQDAGVPYELHIFEGGVHGLAMADGENDLAANVPHIAHWGGLCCEWLALHGLGAPEGETYAKP